jgi:hypothetical protein
VFVPQLAAEKHHFHIQQPGVKIIDQYVTMNKVMQGGKILYCVNDGEWMEYSQAFVLPENAQIIKAKVQYLNKESNTSWLWVENQHEVDTDAVEKNTGATF